MFRATISNLVRKRSFKPKVVTHKINILNQSDQTPKNPENNVLPVNNTGSEPSSEPSLQPSSQPSSQLGLQPGLLPNLQSTEITPVNQLNYLDPLQLQIRLSKAKQDPELTIVAGLKRIEALKTTGLAIKAIFTKSKKLSDQISEDGFSIDGIRDSNVFRVDKQVKFQNDKKVDYIAIFGKKLQNDSLDSQVILNVRENKISTKTEFPEFDRIPMTVILDSVDEITDNELLRHLLQAKICSKIIIPSSKPKKSAKIKHRIYQELPVEVLSSGAKIHTNSTWNDIKSDILSTKHSRIFYTDVWCGPDSDSVNDMEFSKIIMQNDHIFMIISPDGKYSDDALELRDFLRINQKKHSVKDRSRWFMQDVKMDICDLTPDIEQSHKDRAFEHANVELFSGTVTRNRLPGTPVLSSTLANQIIVEAAMALKM